ncbi:unnamed protein product [Rotaria socialis]
MSTRSRRIVRSKSRSRNTINSPTPTRSRIRLNSARDNSLPYGSFTRHHSSNDNELPSSTPRHSNNNENDLNNEPISEFHLSESVQVQQQVPDDQNNDRLPQNRSDSTVSVEANITESSFTPATLITSSAENVPLNDNTNATLTVIRSDRNVTKNTTNNADVLKLFDLISKGVYRCKICQQELKIKENPIPTERKKQLDSALVSCIINDSRSFDDFRKNGMRQCLSIAVPGYIPPHRSTIKRKIVDLYRHHRDLLRLVLAKPPEIALTSDVWRNSNETYFICLTAHFFDHQYKSISLTIGFRQLIGSHIAERLRKYILHELNTLQIQNKICSITTDNASNIICTTENEPCFGTRFSCLAHDLNLIIQDALHLHDKKNYDHNRTTSSHNSQRFIDAVVCDEDGDDYSSSDDDEDEEVPTNSNNNNVDHDEENLDDSFDDETEMQQHQDMISTDDALMNARHLVNRARHFAKLTRRKHLIHDYFKREAKAKKLAGNGLILDCIIRWNSSFYMIDRFINYKIVINDVTKNPRIIAPEISTSMIFCLKQLAFCYEEWEILMALRNVLSKFEEATRLICGKKYQTHSIGYLVLVGLEHHLTQSIPSGQQAHIELIFRKSLYDAYCYHVADKVSSIQKKSMMIACFLDPQTHHSMNDNDKYVAQQHIIDEARSRNMFHQAVPLVNDSSNTIISNLSNGNLNKKDNQLNSFLTGCGLQTLTISSINSHPNRTIHEEIACYIDKVKTFTSFEEFWMANETVLSNLSRFVQSFNIRPTTSVPSESLFSVASYVNRKQRCSLSADTLRYLMTLRDAELVAGLIKI